MVSDRHNEGKPEYSQVDYKSLEPLVRALEVGARKYSRDNWRKGFDKHTLLDCMQRHLGSLIDAVNEGMDEFDDETGVHTIGHLMANCMFYSYHHVVRDKTSD